MACHRHRSPSEANIALSSCTVLWQCSMNMPPQSRNCMVRVTLPPGRRRYTSLRPFSPCRNVSSAAIAGRGSGLLQSGCGSGGPNRRHHSVGSRLSRVPTPAPRKPGQSRALSVGPLFGLYAPWAGLTASSRWRMRPDRQLTTAAGAAAKRERICSAATGMLERSGFGIITCRHLLLTSGVAGLRTMRNSSKLCQRKDRSTCRQARQRYERSLAWLLPSLCSATFTIQTLIANVVAGEINDPVVALGDALLIGNRLHNG